jgi:hypothetical protein
MGLALGMGWNYGVSPEMKSDGDTYTSTPYKNKNQVSEETLKIWEDGFSKPTKDGPVTRGFDWYFSVDVPNWLPYCFIENHRTVGIPSEYLPELLFDHNQASSPEPAVPYWHFEHLYFSNLRFKEQLF